LNTQIESNGEIFSIETNLIGKYNLDNVVAASTIASYFGVPMSDVVTAISSYVPSNSRSQFIKGERNNIILDAYNANPSSMKVAIENFSEVEAEEKMVILGDMLELGAESESEHRGVVNLLLELNFKSVILVGGEFAKISSPYMSFATTSLLLEYLKENSITSRTILVKGSRGIALEQTIAYLK
jgi:UDP-N-acetylmuramoyl-tripeptide--D-alanyl-D-alanine ligase